MLILVLNYQKNNIYNKKIPASTPFIYKGFDAGNCRVKSVFTAYTLFDARSESQPASFSGSFT